MSASVLDQAQNVKGVVAAARMRDRFARKEADATDESERRLYREAIFDLHERFPELDDILIGSAERFARERGHGKGSGNRGGGPVHEGRRRSRAGSKPEPEAEESIVKPGAKGRGPDRKPIPGIDPTARRSRRSKAARPRRGRAASSTPRVDRAIAQTGIRAAAGSAGSIVMAALGGTVAAGLGYLVLSSVEQKGSGARAFPIAVDGVVRAVGRFLGPGDVFTDNRPTTAAGPTSPQPTAPVQPHGRRAPARLPRATRPHQFNHR